MPTHPVTLYRNQFILGSESVGEAGACRHIEIGPGLILSAHPSLSVEHMGAEDRRRSLTLLGYLLDPEDPAADDNRILRRLFEAMERADDVPRLTAGLCGRWAIVARDAHATLLFHDPAGARRVYFATRDGTTWCGTRAETLAEFLGCEIDPMAAAYARSADFVFMRGGRFWPGDGALHQGIRRLLPNHWLDLARGTVKRYWPVSRIEPVAADRAVEFGARMLPRLMRAAAARFRLVLMLTGGRDSRTVLAASRELRHDLRFLSMAKYGADDPDPRVAGALLGSLGLPHLVVTPRGGPARPFWRAYRANSPHANRDYAANAEAIAPHLGSGHVAVWGNMAEIFKVLAELYGIKLKGRVIDATDPSDLVRVTGHGKHPYAGAAFARWLESAGECQNVGLIDLVYWEQRMGGWLGGWVNDYDMVWQEWMSPFNCRALLETMLGVEEAFRGPPDHLLQTALIERLWPELLSVPFCSPRPRPKGLGGAILRRARLFGVGCYRRLVG